MRGLASKFLEPSINIKNSTIKNIFGIQILNNGYRDFSFSGTGNTFHLLEGGRKLVSNTWAGNSVDIPKDSTDNYYSTLKYNFIGGIDFTVRNKILPITRQIDYDASNFMINNGAIIFTVTKKYDWFNDYKVEIVGTGRDIGPQWKKDINEIFYRFNKSSKYIHTGYRIRGYLRLSYRFYAVETNSGENITLSIKVERSVASGEDDTRFSGYFRITFF